MTTLLFIPTVFGASPEAYSFLLALGLPTYFILRWILKKFIKVESLRRIATLVTTLIVTPFIYSGLIAFWLISISYYPSHDFDKEKWFSNKEKRFELSKDIIKSKMLINKTKAEVQQILGDEENSGKSDYWNYYLGFKPGFANIDPYVLDIEFKKGKVIRVGQHET
ncbi:MAG: hypothetical protein JZU47_13570 [Prolixibacteraceae bacterium]|nr:hypothetical protein [Prolixibacteraceae bacterium]